MSERPGGTSHHIPGHLAGSLPGRNGLEGLPHGSRPAPTQPAPPAQIVRQAVDAARELVEPAIRETVEALPGVLRLAAGYHFGWWEADGTPVANPARGKGLRPALVLLAAQAVGGLPADAVRPAVAIELVHNFSLIHDDVMDGDATRRHRPTVWKVFGVAQAILVGDALLTLAYDVLGGLDGPGTPAGGWGAGAPTIPVQPDALAAEHGGSSRSRVAARMFGTAIGDLLHGQGDDLAFEHRDDVTVAECMAMARRKTGALLECACGLGALLAGGSAEQVARLRAYGADLGLAFQLTDDLLGIWGDTRVTGKPVHSDLRSRKRSLPVVAALTSGSPAAAALRQAYAHEEALDDADLARLADAVADAGGRDWCVARAKELIGRALDRLHTEPPLARTLELAAFAAVLLHRDR
ncbi:MAG: polyprenyl synthetase family protein [Hamadaea sp.]|nr:polyprenyl synthetase family protein [Hamadaea sp.]